MQDQTLSGKHCLITGASSGIGAACARLLANFGAQIILGYHQGQARAEHLRKMLPGRGHRILRIPLTDWTLHEDIANDLKVELGHLDILVNSAGYTLKVPHHDLDALSAHAFNSIITANAAGTYSITRALIPLLQIGNSPVVINVSSIASFTGGGSNVAYGASKAAVDTMTMSLAKAFGNIRFICVSPGSVDTNFVVGRSKQDLENIAMRTPMKKVITAHDVAETIYACVAHLKMTTGTRVIVDGGQSL